MKRREREDLAERARAFMTPKEGSGPRDVWNTAIEGLVSQSRVLQKRDAAFIKSVLGLASERPGRDPESIVREIVIQNVRLWRARR